MNLLNIVKNYLPIDFQKNAAVQTGESETGVSNFMSAALPTIIGALIGKFSQNKDEAFNLTQTTTNSGILGKITGFLQNSGSDSGLNLGGIVGSLFGQNGNSIVQSLASFAGIKTNSAQNILGLTSGAALGATGQYAKDNNLDAAGLGSFLSSQKPLLSSWIPSGFDFGKIAGGLGLASLFGANTEAKAAVTPEPRRIPNEINTHTTPEPSKGNGWLMPIIILLALAAIIFYFMKQCNEEKPIDVTIPVTDTMVTAPVQETNPEPIATAKGKIDEFGNWVADLGANKVIKLQDGTELTVGENSTEYRLYQFLSDNNFKVDDQDKTKNWISLDRVYFETGKANLTEASQAQVKNIAAILKNYPSAVIKIGGYTDNTGDAAINKKVSAERAQKVANTIEALGAKKGQIDEAEGYGPEHPIATNDTEEGKAQNRRVDLKVAAK